MSQVLFLSPNFPSFSQERNAIYEPTQKRSYQPNSAINFLFLLGEYLHPSTLPRPLYYSTAHPKVNGLFLAAWNATFQTGV